MENILASVGFFVIVSIALLYVNGFADTLRVIRSIRLPRLTLPDWVKRDVQAVSRMLLTRMADATIYRNVVRPEVISRLTF